MGRIMTLVKFQSRREARQPIEMMAHFRHDVMTVTVMLKDITPHGAKIEGVGRLEKDTAAFLVLPGLAPKLAFVAWATDHAAGLEFAEPLEQSIYASLIADFGRKAPVFSLVA